MQDDVLLLDDFADAHDMHSIIQGGLIPGRKSQEGQAVSVFHSRQPDVRQSKSRRSSIRSRQTQNHGVLKYLESSPKYSILVRSEPRSNERIAVLSNPIARNRSSQQTTCDLRKWYTWRLEGIHTAKYINPQGYYSRQIQDPPDPEARKSTDHDSEQSVQYRKTCRSLLEDTRRKHPEESQRGKYRETCRGNVDYRIPFIPHSTVQKEDLNRKEIVKRLIQQFENHPNRHSLIQDLNKTEEFNPFSEKLKELITSMGNTEYFELCGTSSEIQCPDCALYLEAGIIYWTCGKCMQPTQKDRQLNKARYDVLSIPGYVIQKNPTHGARHGQSVRQCMNYKAHDMRRKARKHKSGGYKTFLERWHDDDKYRKSLSDIRWTEEQIIHFDAIALEDHSCAATWQERSRNGKSWKVSLNAESIQRTIESAQWL